MKKDPAHFSLEALYFNIMQNIHVYASCNFKAGFTKFISEVVGLWEKYTSKYVLK